MSQKYNSIGVCILSDDHACLCTYEGSTIIDGPNVVWDRKCVGVQFKGQRLNI